MTQVLYMGSLHERSKILLRARVELLLEQEFSLEELRRFLPRSFGLNML